MEYEIEIAVRRYEDSSFPGVIEPREVTVYRTKRYIKGGNPGKLYDLFDAAKAEADVAIDADISEHCEHDSLQDTDLDVCLVCGETRKQLEAEAEEAKIDRAIEAKLWSED